MSQENFVVIDGKKIQYGSERNLLELIRKANIDLPTFCYHSELSIHGACRLCLVDIKGKGINASCSMKPEPGLELKTNTSEIREIRKISLELLLASSEHNCNTCSKSSNCKLQELANRYGVTDVRFKKLYEQKEIDYSSHSLVRDPNKCILCGDCVRACEELQGIGAIDFAFRGAGATVLPAFGENLADSECVDCGQCARVCPTGALTPKSEIDLVWKAIEDPAKVVVVEIAPAVRVAVGEEFGMKSGMVLTGQMVAACKMLGFDRVFDSSFGADLTVIEEANEFLKRKESGENLPIFTSCCPSWVKCMEQSYPEMLPNLSTCKSPQQMLGAVAKKLISEDMKIEAKDIVVVSIMPCTSKKGEARREELSNAGIQDVDFVLTTQEFAKMVKQSGIRFENLAPESMDEPFGFKTGAGLLFGNSGGVTEAVVRYAYEKMTGNTLVNHEVTAVRGNKGIKELEMKINNKKIKLAIVYGLKNAKQLVKEVKAGKKEFDMVEVMACPGGCVGGAGQPVSFNYDILEQRTKAIYNADKMMQLHKSQENPYIKNLYEHTLSEPNSETAHHLLHTGFTNRRKRIDDAVMQILKQDNEKIKVSVCVGTSCYIKNSTSVLNKLMQYVKIEGLEELVEVEPTFCLDNCGKGPNASIDGEVISEVTYKKLQALIRSKLNERMSVIEENEDIKTVTL